MKNKNQNIQILLLEKITFFNGKILPKLTNLFVVFHGNKVCLLSSFLLNSSQRSMCHNLKQQMGKWTASGIQIDEVITCNEKYICALPCYIQCLSWSQRPDHWGSSHFSEQQEVLAVQKNVRQNKAGSSRQVVQVSKHFSYTCFFYILWFAVFPGWHTSISRSHWKVKANTGTPFFFRDSY